MNNILILFRGALKEKSLKKMSMFMLDPTPYHAEKGINAINFVIYLGDAKITELILKIAK